MILKKKVCRITVTLYEGSVPILESKSDFTTIPEEAESLFDQMLEVTELEFETKKKNKWSR